LGLALINHESATQRFPLASDMHALVADPDPNSNALVKQYWGYNVPLRAQPGEGGFSWIVKTLPYMEENALSDAITATSRRYSMQDVRGAFADYIVISDNAAVAEPDHASVAPIGPLLCPSYAGEEEAGWDGYDVDTGGQTTNKASAGNYVAVVGTHAESTRVVTVNGVDYFIEENGAIISGRVNRGRGSGIGDLRDGVSKTVLISESKDERYSSWYCGESAWVLAFVPTLAFREQDIPRTQSGLLDFTEAIANGDAAMGLQYGPDASGVSGPYWEDYSTRASGGHRNWGPSSEHSGGVVIHTFGDGHVLQLPSSVDPGVYYAMVSKSGGESFDVTQN
jgi:hypothetical protein